MTPNDDYEVPFATDSAEVSAEDSPSESKPDVDQNDPAEPILSEEEASEMAELTQPFVGEWNTLISTTNWEKGRIISEWRAALLESGADSTQFSDEAWSRKVGGVTAPHVGRLRRVYDRFENSYESYEGVYWSHFLAALDWDDAPLWLEGASKEKWSVSNMREHRWQAHGAVESERPTKSQVIEVDTDEDVVIPAQGGGRIKDYDESTSGVASGPAYEGPDFGDEEELASLGGGEKKEKGNASSATAEPSEPPVQPFVGLAELPEDLTDALEGFKLALLRHKSDGWRDVDVETVQKYLDAIGVMIRA